MAELGLTLGSVAAVLRARGLLAEAHGSEDVAVSGVSQDSRSVEPGDLFVAWVGVEHDAHRFLPAAVAAGAVAAVVERRVHDAAVPQLVVRDGRLAGALAADIIARSPWRELHTAAVTGTNGKTTTAVLARHLLAAKGASTAIGTLGLIEADGEVRPGTEGLTTPGPVQVAGWLREMADAGIACVVMEASSHALDQRRLDGIRFDTAVFTNIGRDHLDYHRDQEAYVAAKARLLDLVKDDGNAVVNQEEPAWASLARQGVRRLSYGTGESADLRAREVELHDGGARFELVHGDDGESVDVPLLGRFNVENALAAAGVAVVAGIPLSEVARRLRTAPQVDGRLELVTRAPCPVLIDFAHTPDALGRVLATLRPLVRGRLIVVFGAGGDRDAAKRPLMGGVVARWADVAVVTSDNPRSEDPEAIIDDIVAGIPEFHGVRLADRRHAIRAALEMATEGDLVLLAGKGHERYQVVGRERMPLDEREVVHSYLSGGALR
jgi:UDP-N-acetylmuramoyl-L-alanyl-D-glutamate--2,6-diaminopimelate ligase